MSPIIAASLPRKKKGSIKISIQIYHFKEYERQSSLSELIGFSVKN